ncbi:MAG: hypothetical protein HYW49_10960 [Deltaproteobacteria bacterium]|nr:hypothetical protein [Deltaproteobacteria bacterium]
MKKLFGWMIVGLTLGALPAGAFTLVELAKQCPPGYEFEAGSASTAAAPNKFCCKRKCVEVPGCVPHSTAAQKDWCAREIAKDQWVACGPTVVFIPALKRCCALPR